MSAAVTGEAPSRVASLERERDDYRATACDLLSDLPGCRERAREHLRTGVRPPTPVAPPAEPMTPPCESREGGAVTTLVLDVLRLFARYDMAGFGA